MKVKLKQIGKRFNYDWIFRNIDFTLLPEKKYAISGPNGSGKSTFLKILSGHLSPSKGKITFSKEDKVLDISQVYKEISYAAPYIDLVEEFTLKEAINFHQEFKTLYPEHSTAKLIDLLGFKGAEDKAIRYFSSGMKQRLKLALAICSQSSLLLLDEPSTNLDLQGIDWYRKLIKNYSNNRLIVIASNADVDFDFCEEQIDILQYKKKKKRSNL